MLLIPPPFEHVLPNPSAPPKVLFTTYTGKPWYWLNTRTAAPPTSGPVSAQTFLKNREFTILNRPPRAQIAPPPSYSVSFFELPSTNVRFCTVTRGWSWLSQ